MEPNYTRICEYCKRLVDIGEGIVEASQWYHDPCYLSKTGKRLNQLSRKVENGQITAQEAREFDDLKTIIENVKKSVPGRPLTQDKPVMKGSACKALGYNTLRIKKIDNKKLENPNNALETIKNNI